MSKTFKDVVDLLIDTNIKLSKGEIKIETAKQICANTQVLINAARLTLDVAKYTGEKQPEFFLESVIEPIDETLKKIEEKNKKPLEL